VKLSDHAFSLSNLLHRIIIDRNLVNGKVMYRYKPMIRTRRQILTLRSVRDGNWLDL